MITIILSHPELENSVVNRRVYETLNKRSDMQFRHLEALYPNGDIDVLKEQDILLKSDIIIFMFPFYWYSSPHMLKLYQDSILTYEFAYGQKGDKLDNKPFFVATSTGGDERSYTAGGRNNYTMSELLRPFQQMAFLTRMQYKSPIVFHNAPLLGMTPITDELLTRVDAYTKKIEDTLAHIQK
jgi:glutathione-regulated potassium-efflux system ancillary protein KefG